MLKLAVAKQIGEAFNEEERELLEGNARKSRSPHMYPAYFPWGKLRPSDPTRHITSFKKAWGTVKKNANVKGRWHDNRLRATRSRVEIAHSRRKRS